MNLQMFIYKQNSLNYYCSHKVHLKKLPHNNLMNALLFILSTGFYNHTTLEFHSRFAHK